MKRQFKPFIWSDWDSDPAHAIWIGSEESKTNSENLNSFSKNVCVDGIIEARALDD